MSKKIKLGGRAQALLMMGVMVALSRETDSPVADTVRALKAPLTEEEKNKARGLSYFEMPDGSTVPAINYKNAHKKWLKKKQ